MALQLCLCETFLRESILDSEVQIPGFIIVRSDRVPRPGRGVCLYFRKNVITGQVGLGVGSWPSNRATEGLNPKGTRLYFVILLKNVEKIFDWH